MIGLKRNTVKVVDYDPDWAMLALEYCRVVRNACGELLVDVQHVGSYCGAGVAAEANPRHGSGAGNDRLNA
jgi:GrpB-like predicted nucleotidyltransferase (UPF0157 family)